MEGCGCICKTGFYFGSGSAKMKKTPTLSIEKLEEIIRQRAHVPEMHCASSDAKLYPGMHGLTQDEGSSRHTCASEDDCSI